MKNKGFTLIELIGVVVILGLISLVAFPALLNQIKNSKEQINDSTKQIIYSAGESYLEKEANTYSKVEGVSYCISFDKLLNDGFINKGLISEDLMTKQFLQAKYSDHFEFDIVEKNSCLIEGLGITYNPVSKTVDCNINDDNCYNWNVLGFNDTEVTLIMNQNLGVPVGWCNGKDSRCHVNSNTNEPVTANEYLSSLTTNWVNKPRLITVSEIERINDFTFDPDSEVGIPLKTKWLYQNLSSLTASGYWTNEPYKPKNRAAWLVSLNGLLGYTDMRGDVDGHPAIMGVRPVISVERNMFN